MNTLMIVVLVLIGIYSSLSWLLPKILAWLFKQKYRIKLQIGRIVIPQFTLKDVTLSRGGYSIQIDELSFKSSFFNSENNKLLCIIIKDVRINNNVEEKKSAVENIFKPLLSKQNSRTDGKKSDDANNTKEFMTKLDKIAKNKSLDFRDVKLPPSIAVFAQFMSVHAYNISVMVLHNDSLHTDEGWLLHGSASALHIDGGGGGAAKTLLVSATVLDASAKLLPRKKHVCLGELSCGLVIETTLKASGPVSVEKIHATVSSPTMTIDESLSAFLQGFSADKPVKLEPKHASHIDIAIEKISPIIPKMLILKIDTTTLTGVRSNARSDFQASIHSVQINSRFSIVQSATRTDIEVTRMMPQIYIAFQMDQFKVNTVKDKLFHLNKLKLDAKLEKGVLNLYLILNTITVMYNHEDFFKWYQRNIQRDNQSSVTETPNKIRQTPTPLKTFFDSCVLQGCVELRSVTIHSRLANSATMALGCGGLKVKLDQLVEMRGDAYKSTFVRLLLGQRHWCAELLLDAAWLCTGPISLSVCEPPPKKKHSWGTGVFIGVALVKWGSHGSFDTKIESMMDCLRIEWSSRFAETLIVLLECLNEYRSKSKDKIQDSVTETSSRHCIMNVALSHVNVFTIIDEGMCFMTRLDAFTLESNSVKTVFVVSGLKIVDIMPHGGGWACQRAEDILITFFHIKLARFDIVPPTQETLRYVDVQFLETVDIEWGANLHMKMYTLIKNIGMFKSAVTCALNNTNVVLDGTLEEEPIQSEIKTNWCVSFKADTAFGIVLSADNHLILTCDDLTISRDKVNGLSIVWASMRAILNDEDICNVRGFTLERLSDDPNIRVERLANEMFKLKWNKVWGVTIDSFRLIFPYKHRFAEAIQGEFVSLFKWLKIIHNFKKKPFTADSPLPSDLMIKITELLIEMSDDPFEVKLRDNYELLEDEYKERQKRRDMLEEKIQELCKPNLFLPASKLEELYAALSEKDVEIYIQRSRAAPPPRTRLVAMHLASLSIVSLADPVIHGTLNCINQMKQIDADSPWPEDSYEFSTLWCRAISARCGEWRLLLRDFPQPLVKMQKLHLFGTLLGAETAAPARAYRTVKIEQGEPWGAFQLERSMMPLKFYYDLCCELETFSYAFGPCWEPAMAQCNISFEQVSRPSLDPSLPLPWWDKVRLLMHGRLTANFTKFTCLLHASLDPYNTTEEMELSWNDLLLDWTNGKIVMCGSLNVYVRTASKYDDCRLIHVPWLRLGVKMSWQCVADPRDHHSVAPCAPDKLPEYSSNQEHDSFRAFRSQGLDLNVSFETKPCETIGPVLLLYGSTLRWFESLKLILSGVTRPTRRGPVFNNVKPRRPQLSRHYKSVTLSVTLHNFQICYWSSSSMQRGVELIGNRVTCGCEYALSVRRVTSDDDVTRRPRLAATARYVTCQLATAEIWLKSALQTDLVEESITLETPVEKCYCLSVRLVSYSRSPTHKLTVEDLRGAWTKMNRDVAFALFDTYIKTQQLKKNLSTEALKEEKKIEPQKPTRDTIVVSPPPSAGYGLSPGVGAGASMLAQLVAEASGEAPVVFSDDLSEPRPEPTHVPPAPLPDDDATTNWLIVLVNSQVLLKGCESRGYLMVCAARTELRQRVTNNAVAWSGAFTCMQYYATVSDHWDEEIQWVSVDEIEEQRGETREISALPDVPRLVGSGHSAGGVIGSTVGPASHTQLQRIVSRCACEFYLVWADEEASGEGMGGGIGAWPGHPPPQDSFKLMHHDLELCTNSLQYAMLLDVVNNLVLFVEPERRRVLELRARVRFQLQLHKEDPRQPVMKLQTQIRECLAKLRRLEKESYLKRRALQDTDQTITEEIQMLDRQVNECKEQVLILGSELDAMLRAWRHLQPAPPPPSAPAPPHRHYEICFKSARWRLNDADGQLGIADLVLTNFLYTKTSRSDDSVEHQLDVGYIRVTNLLPREPFPEVLVAEEPAGSAVLSRRAALRVFCRDRPPVGGISVKEHLEVNIVPIRIGLTKKFFNTMLKFCFPERDPDVEGIEGDDDDTVSMKSGVSSAHSSRKQKKKEKKDSNFYVKIHVKDDVEKMKERAEKNKLFIHIKIPEVAVRVSYKGSKEKNLADVRDLPLVLPTLEYHNCTWTWLDLLLAIKNDTRRVILSQAIRHSLQLHRRVATAPEPQEEDKARLLLGNITADEKKPHKKGVFKISKQ